MTAKDMKLSDMLKNMYDKTPFYKPIVLDNPETVIKQPQENLDTAQAIQDLYNSQENAQSGKNAPNLSQTLPGVGK